MSSWRPSRNASREQKCSNAPRLATASNGPKRLARQRARVEQPHVEPVAAARGGLRRGQRDADPGPALRAHVVQQRAPPAPEIEQPPAGPDPDLLGDVLVLAPLRLLEAAREVAVVLGPAEVRQLAEAEPEDAIDQRVREVHLRPVGHVRSPAAGPRGRARARARAGRRRRSRPRRAARRPAGAARRAPRAPSAGRRASARRGRRRSSSSSSPARWRRRRSRNS